MLREFRLRGALIFLVSIYADASDNPTFLNCRKRHSSLFDSSGSFSKAGLKSKRFSLYYHLSRLIVNEGKSKKGLRGQIEAAFDTICMNTRGLDLLANRV